MLGTLGFCAAALAFLAYAYSSGKIANKPQFAIKSYRLAYMAAGIASLIWAVGTLAGNSTLEAFVLAGDAFIMAATVLLLRTVVPAKDANLASGAVAIVLAGALFWRAVDSGADPVLRDNILVFNTPRPFAAFLAIVLLLIWVRANVCFYRKVVASTLKSDVLRYSYFIPNIMAFLGISSFLFAERSLTIVLGFATVIVAFLILTGFNYAVVSAVRKGAHHG